MVLGIQFAASVIVIIVTAIIRRIRGLIACPRNRVADRGLLERLRLSLYPVGGHGIQRGLIVGVQAGRVTMTAIPIVSSVGDAAGGVIGQGGICQFYLISQLNMGKVRDMNINIPHKAFPKGLAAYCRSVLIIMQDKGCLGLICSSHTVSVENIAHSFSLSKVLRALGCSVTHLSNCESQIAGTLDKFKIICTAGVIRTRADHINNFGAGAQEVKDLILNLCESELLIVRKVVHKRGSPRILRSAYALRRHRIAVVSGGLCGLIHLIRQVKSLVNRVRILFILLWRRCL